MKLTFAEHKILENIHAEITENFLNPISLKDLSLRYSISETKLTQGFRRIYNITVYGYYLERRMYYAKNKLMKGADVREVAEALNYSSTSSFARAFRKVFPKAPGAYRYRTD